MKHFNTDTLGLIYYFISNNNDWFFKAPKTEKMESFKRWYDRYKDGYPAANYRQAIDFILAITLPHKQIS